MSLSSTKIGFVGTGTMSSAMVRGLSTLAQPPSQIIVSPRNADKAAALQQEFPSIVSIGTSNQDVLDRSDLVFLGVLPRLAEEVCSALQFDAHHTVISLISTAPLASLREWCAPSEVGRAIPLPPVALHKGATILSPPLPLSVQVFSALGTAVPVETEEQMKKMMPVTGLMGQFYAQQRSTQDWLKRQGIPEETAAAYVGAIFHCISYDSAAATAHTFDELVKEQTPGGINEQVVREMTDAGCYAALHDSLDGVLARIEARPAPTRKKRPYESIDE